MHAGKVAKFRTYADKVAGNGNRYLLRYQPLDAHNPIRDRLYRSQSKWATRTDLWPCGWPKNGNRPALKHQCATHVHADV